MFKLLSSKDWDILCNSFKTRDHFLLLAISILPPCPFWLSPAPPAPSICPAAAPRQGCCPVVPVRRQLPTSSGCCGSFEGYQPPVFLFCLRCSCPCSCSVHGPWSLALQPLISASATCRDRQGPYGWIHCCGCIRSTCFP